MRTAVTAVPSIEESSTRRRPLPMVLPKPCSNGSITKRPYSPVKVSASGRTLLGSSKLRQRILMKVFLSRSGGLSSRARARPRPGRGGRCARSLGAQLDDQLLLDRMDDVLAPRRADDADGERVAVDLEPGRHGVRLVDFQRFGHLGADRLALARGDLVARAHLERGHVDPAAVDGEVPVVDELARVVARQREPGSQHHVVEPALEQRHQVLAGVALEALGLVEVLHELAFLHAVDALELLLLAQVHAVVGDLGALLGVDAGRIVAPLLGALVGEAALPLEEELHALPAAELALVGDVTGHMRWCLLDAALLARPAAVVGQRRHVLDRADGQAGGGQRADGRLAARAGAAHAHLHFLEAVAHGAVGGVLGGALRGEGRALARALEAGVARRAGGQRVAARAGDGDVRVVERRLDVGDAPRDVLAQLALGGCLAHGLLHSLHGLLAGHGLARTLARARVGARALAAHRQAAPVAQPAIAADVAQAVDRGRHLPAQLALDRVVLLDVGRQVGDLFLGQVARPQPPVEPQVVADAHARGAADAVDVGERDLQALVVGDVDPDDARHWL